MKKPFYTGPIAYFLAKRKKYNPMRFFLGDFYYSSDPMKMDIDTKDIQFNPLQIKNKNI